MNNKKALSIVYYVHAKFEQARVWIHGHLPRQSNLRESGVYRFFGATLLRRDLWSFKSEPLARGLALGLFVAFTPTLGFQMVIVCGLILLFPGNLPVALAACWTTNIFTAPPIYMLELKFGRWLIELVGAGVYRAMEDNPAVSHMYDIAGAMWLGSLVTGVIAGMCGYLIMHGLVGVERRLRMMKIIQHRSMKVTTTPDDSATDPKPDGAVGRTGAQPKDVNPQPETVASVEDTKP